MPEGKRLFSRYQTSAIGSYWISLFLFFTPIKLLITSANYLNCSDAWLIRNSRHNWITFNRRYLTSRDSHLVVLSTTIKGFSGCYVQKRGVVDRVTFHPGGGIDSCLGKSPSYWRSPSGDSNGWKCFADRILWRIVVGWTSSREKIK